MSSFGRLHRSESNLKFEWYDDMSYRAWMRPKKSTSICLFCIVLYPIGSMYGIFTYIYHKNQLNVGEYIMHGSYGYVSPELTPSQMLHCKTSWWFQRICVFIPHCRNCSNLTTVMFFQGLLRSGSTLACAGIDML